MTNPFQTIPSVDQTTLVCKIGDRLMVREAALTEEGAKVEPGSLYEVEGRVQYAWILRLVNGSGATELRILNSRVMSFLMPIS